jgi:hypothetical protein
MKSILIRNFIFFKLILFFEYISLIIISRILNLLFVYFFYSKALHVKCRLLPEGLISSPNIGTGIHRVIPRYTKSIPQGRGVQ